MDRKRILLVKLDKGKLKDSADLLGSLLMAKVQVAAFSRSDVPQRKRVPFYLYIDEFQNFASDSFATILSEARKYGLSLVMAHQTLAQISPELRSLILGNTGIQVYFRANRQDAQLLAKEAFEYSGFEVKSVRSFSPKYWSLGEEWELHTEELQKLSPRECYVKHKIEGGLIGLQTVEVKPPRALAGITEEEFAELVDACPFGRKYLVERASLRALASGPSPEVPDESERFDEKAAANASEAVRRPDEKHPEAVARSRKPKKGRPEAESSREDLLPEEEGVLEFILQHPGTFVTPMYQELGLSGYRGDRLKESLIRKGLIVQEETRAGKRGRLAKVLALTAAGHNRAKQGGVAGKGGDDHKRLQEMFREQAEVYDWTAVVEERIPRTQETVDVGLRKGDVRVAIEISSTTKAEHEMQNIRKCLEAGYDYVVSVCAEDKRLQMLKAEAKKSFSPRELERIRFFAPSRVKDFLKSLSVPAIVSENPIVSGQISRQKQLMDMNEASEYLGIRKNTLYEWVIERKIPHVRVGRLLKFRREDLENWLRKRTREEKDRDFV
jgi:excisionase family DNA binding protein